VLGQALGAELLHMDQVRVGAWEGIKPARQEMLLLSQVKAFPITILWNRQLTYFSSTHPTVVLCFLALHKPHRRFSKPPSISLLAAISELCHNVLLSWLPEHQSLVPQRLQGGEHEAA